MTDPSEERKPNLPVPPGGPGGPRGSLNSDGASVQLLLRALRKNWFFILLLTAAVGGLTTFRTMGEVRIYEAQATVLFDPSPPRPLGGKVEAVVELGNGNVWDTREYYETQYQIIRSHKVALATVQELGLHRDAGFIGNLPPGRTAPASEPVTEEQAAEVLRGRYRVEPVKNSRLALVRLEDANPERAARILAALVDTYVSQNLEEALSSTTSAGEWLRSQLDKLKVDLESSELALHDYKKDKNILSVNFDDQSNMLREEMRHLNETLTSVRAKKEEVTARRSELVKVTADDPENLPSSEFLNSPALTAARSNFQHAVAARDALVAAKKGSNNLEVLAAEAQVAATRRALVAEIRNIKGALDREVAVVSKNEGGLTGLFERAKKQALELNLLEIEYNRLKRNKENTEKLYQLVQEREKESSLTRMMRINNIRVVDRPRVPKAPVRPNVPMGVGSGVGIGLLLGLGLALLRTLLDRTLKTPDDVEQKLGVTFLGLVPEIDRAERKPARPRRGAAAVTGAPELIVHERPNGAIAEAARVVRTNLLFMAPDKPFKRLLVTSSGPSEGKTTFATCMATAMAQGGKRTLLVDCDLRRPRIHRIFKSGSTSGLTTALFEDQFPEDAIKETPVDNLWVLPAGPIPPNPADLFHSDRFKRILTELDARFDRVIIDSPPVAVVTDAAILSTHVDGVVLIARAFKTQTDLARYALRSLTDIGASVAGVVLNAVNLDRSEYKYGYTYYRRDRYYYAESEGDGAPPPGA